MKFYREATLSDEHQQTINIYQNQDGYWWEFKFAAGEKYGPFKDATEAILDAQHFCDCSAITQEDS